MARRVEDAELLEAVEAFRTYGTKAEAARALDLAPSTLSDRLAMAEERLGLRATDVVVAQGRTDRRPRKKMGLPKSGEVKRYVLTSAQNNTRINPAVWHNLLALAEHYAAEVIVGTYSYNKAAYGEKSVKRGSEPTADDRRGLWYDPEVLSHIADESVQLAPGLVWCGEINILPTAPNPLSRLEAYTDRDSAVFPHARFAMASIASGKHEATKFNFTTGTTTKRNYIQKRAGLVAEKSHGYGGLLVEVCADGSWFVRQLEAAEDGSIQDLDLVADAGAVTSGHRVEAIGWGDVHTRALSKAIEEVCWGEGGMLDELRPRYQFIHDVLDFWARGHHDIKWPHRMFERFVKGYESVEAEVQDVATFLDGVERDWCETLVVDSNHDRAMERWLETTTHHDDPANALFYLEASLELYRAMAAQNTEFHLLEWAVRRAGAASDVGFLREDESMVICREFDDGIECGMHGHLGVNGARGNPKQFARMGRRANTGHAHSAGIYDGTYVGGVAGDMEMGYNQGPSSWSHSHVVTYPKGTRTIVTMWKGRWRA